MKLNAISEEYQPNNRQDGMPQGMPVTKGIVQWFDKQMPTWDRAKRIKFDSEFDFRDTRKDIITFWRDQWKKYAPATFQLGREISWLHENDMWAPYVVDGIRFGRNHDVRFVVLKDKTGTRWQAFPRDVRIGGERPQPRTEYTNPGAVPTMINGQRARWCVICRCWDLGLVKDRSGSQVYRHADEQWQP